MRISFLLLGLLSCAHGVLNLQEYGLVFEQDFTTMSSSAFSVGTDNSGPLGYPPRAPETTWVCHLNFANDYLKFINPNGNYQPFSLDNSHLTIRTQTVNGALTTGLLNTLNNSAKGFSNQWGYFEVSAWLPQGPNTWPAFWMLDASFNSQNQEPSGYSLEIDIFEQYGTPTLYTTLHYWGSPQYGKQFYSTHCDMATGYHQYGLDYQPDFLTFYYDRVQMFKIPNTFKSLDPNAPDGKFDRNMSVIVNNGYTGSMSPGDPIQDMKVQYVRVWSGIGASDFVNNYTWVNSKSWGWDETSITPSTPFRINGVTLQLTLQGDLQVVDTSGNILWRSASTHDCTGSATCRTVFQGDGNWVLYDGGSAFWGSGSDGKGGIGLILQNTQPYITVVNGSCSVVWSASPTIPSPNGTPPPVAPPPVIPPPPAPATTRAATSAALTTKAVTSRSVTSAPATTRAVTSASLSTHAVSSSPLTTKAATSTPLTTKGATTSKVSTTNHVGTSAGLTTRSLTTRVVTSSSPATPPVPSSTTSPSTPPTSPIPSGSCAGTVTADLKLCKSAIFPTAGLTIDSTKKIVLDTVTLQLTTTGAVQVVSNTGGNVLWSTGTSASCGNASACSIVFQNDGNWVLYTPNAAWSTGTFDNFNGKLILMDQIPYIEITKDNVVVWQAVSPSPPTSTPTPNSSSTTSRSSTTSAVSPANVRHTLRFDMAASDFNHTRIKKGIASMIGIGSSDTSLLFISPSAWKGSVYYQFQMGGQMLNMSDTFVQIASWNLAKIGNATGYQVMSYSNITAYHADELINPSNSQEASTPDSKITAVLAGSIGGAALLLIVVVVVIVIIIVVIRKRRSSSRGSNSFGSTSSSSNIALSTSSPQHDSSRDVPMTPVNASPRAPAQMSFSDSNMGPTPSQPGSSIPVGTICQALYPQDGQYYKARIDQIQLPKYLVSYIDFEGSTEWLTRNQIRL